MVKPPIYPLPQGRARPYEEVELTFQGYTIQLIQRNVQPTAEAFSPNTYGRYEMQTGTGYMTLQWHVTARMSYDMFMKWDFTNSLRRGQGDEDG